MTTTAASRAKMTSEPRAGPTGSPLPAVMAGEARRSGFLGPHGCGIGCCRRCHNVTVIAATRPAAPLIEKYPELLEAGRRLDAPAAEWQTAQALRFETRAVAESIVPAVPDEIIHRRPPTPGAELNVTCRVL